MNIQKLIYFIDVVNNLSFTKAARNCHIAQTAMSRTISSLEHELGVILFNRNNRQVSLTDEGKEFYTYAMHIVEVYREAVDHMDMLAKNRKYDLNIGIGPYESILLKPFLSNFTALFPQINLSCMQFSYEKLGIQLVNGVVDVMFCVDYCLREIRDIEYFPIYDASWGIITSQSHRFAALEKISLNELSGEMIVVMNEYNLYNYKRKIEKAGGAPAGFIRVNTNSAKLLFVQSGLGIGFAPKFIKDNMDDDLSFVQLEDKLEDKFICAYQQKKRNPLFKKFLEHIKTQIRFTDDAA